MKQRLLNPQAARRVIAGLLLLFMALPMMAQGQSKVSVWDGTSIAQSLSTTNNGKSPEDPVLITTAAELAYLAQQTNTSSALELSDGKTISYGKETGSSGFRDIHFALDADIDLAGYNWTPIGITGHYFRGNFDGKGHCVSGLSAITNDIGYAGLFGYTFNNTIQNLGVKVHEKGINANGENCCAGGIAGLARIIRNCYVEGPGLVEAAGTGISIAGGIAGDAEEISNCYATVDVKANGGSGGCYAGGIVGQSYNTKLSCTYATGSVEATEEDSYAGGICGQFEGTLSYNLALNKEIKGGIDYVHRIVGRYTQGGGAFLISNYASPETYVNDMPVDNQEANDFNGSDEGIDLTNYATTLKTAPASSGVANEWDSDAWDFDGKGLLPQLRMVTGEDDGGKPIYEAWNPNSPQPQLRAGNHMGVTKIKNDGGGNGDSWAEAIKIANSAELKYLGKMVNTKGNLAVGSETIQNNGTGFKDKHFILTDNIDLSAYHWVPIGNIVNNFSGHFDGKGYCISGLSVGYGSEQYQYAGLFGFVKNGTIQNLGVRLAENGGIWGSGYAGGIVGCIATSSTIRNCYVEGPGKVISTGNQHNDAGGIAGATIGTKTTLSHCYATVDVEASGGNYNYAGGIAGYGTGNISYTYATGSIQASGNGNNNVGGICGYVHDNTTLSNNLALNKEIKGNGEYIHRVAGYVYPIKSILTNNYASPEILVNDNPVSSKNTDKEDGSDENIDLTNYATTLKATPDGAVNEWNSGAWVFDTNGLLPQLQMVIGKDADENPTYGEWNSDSPQPQLQAIDYMPGLFTLHIVAPDGGSVTVKDGEGNEITHGTNGTSVLSGTTLTLSQSANDNYDFVSFLSSTDPNRLSNCDATLTMPKSELWVSAQFKEKPKPEPEPDQETPDPPYVPIYYTVTIPSVEGATTEPGPGDHEVESWNTFRFYLTLDTAYSDSQPVVTTSRGETLTPRTSDGAYLVKYVRTDVEVFIDGILPNHPTANAAIEADALRIYALGSTLVIYAPLTAEAMLCDLSGRLLHTYQLAPGQTRIEGLRAGIYIVKVPGFEGVKVVIR